jgi:hypothetical protein
MGTCKCRGSHLMEQRKGVVGGTSAQVDRASLLTVLTTEHTLQGARASTVSESAVRTLPGYGDWLEREHHPHLRKQMAEAGAIAPPTPSCSRSTLRADRYSLEKPRVESDQACVVRSGRPADVARDARSSRNLPALRQRTTADGSGIGKSRRKRSTAALSPSIVILAERCASASGRSLQSTASSVPGSVSIVASA